MDSVPSSEKISQSKIIMQKQFHIQIQEGRCVVNLRFKSKHVHKNSKSQALDRFILLENNFQRNPLHMEKYSSIMWEYIDLGHMVLIPELKMSNPDYFLSLTPRGVKTGLFNNSV